MAQENNRLPLKTDSFEISGRLATVLDDRKVVKKLSGKISEMVDEFCAARGIDRSGAAAAAAAAQLPAASNGKVAQDNGSRKRSLPDQSVENGDSVVKRSKLAEVAAVQELQQEQQLDQHHVQQKVQPEAQPAAPAMTTDQIRAMMANTLKEIEARKQAIGNLKAEGNPAVAAAVAAAASASAAVSKASLLGQGPPNSASRGPLTGSNSSSGSTEDKARTIAALQEQIAARLSKVGLPAASGPQPPRPKPDSYSPMPSALILDSEGRTVDAMGHEVGG